MGRLKNMSLRAKLISMVTISMILIGIGSLYSLNKLESSFKEEISTSYSYYAQSLSEKIAAQFFERYGDVQVFAVDTTTQHLDKDLLPHHLNTFVEKYGIYELILVVDKNGKYVASNTKDTTGKTIQTKAFENINFQNSPWFKAAIAGNFTDDKARGFSDTFFEEPHWDPLFKTIYGEDRVSMGFTTAIRSPAGEVIGVITNRSSTKWLDTEMQTMYDTIVEAGDELVNFSIANKQGQLLSEIEPPENNQKKNPTYSSQRFLKLNMQDIFEEVVKLASSGKHGSTEIFDKVDGFNNIVGYYHIDGPKWPSSIGWNVFIHNSSDEVMTAANAAHRNFLIILTGVILLAVIISIYISLNLSNELSGISTYLGQNSSQVSDAAIKIASSSTQLSSAAQKQAAALQQTVAAVDEISAMVDKNAEAANRSKGSSEESRAAATRGREIVENMVSAIQQINQANEDVSKQVSSNNDKLSEITRLINDIEGKTKVINDIVFQTKLLSFNASVEAARAGEYGKGFSVVAEEVGKLAQLSGTSAKEITSLLDESVRKVQQIAEESKERIEFLITQSNEKVKLGSQTATECDQALEEILNSVSTVDSLVSEIAVASSEQATGIREIAKAVSQMEEITQENAAASESASVAAEQLSSQSSSLNSLVEKLVTIVTGDENSSVGLQKEKKPKKNEAVLAKVIPLKGRTEPQVKLQRKKVSSETSPMHTDPGFTEPTEDQ